MALDPNNEDDQRWSNRTGLRFIIDGHVVTDSTAEALVLKQLHIDGWIDLELTDVTRTEWLTAQPEKLQELEDLGLNYIEYYGPQVLGHSRLGSSVLGSPEDEERLKRVFSILFPGTDFETARKQHIRDAMNVATAIRYAVNGFVTCERRLLNKREIIRATFNDFAILSPGRAAEIAKRMVARYGGRHG
jgi:hypothetical protein